MNYKNSLSLNHMISMALSLMTASLLYYGYLSSSISEFAERWTALASYVFLKIIGVKVQIHGTTLASSDFTVRIIDECTAVGPILLMSGAVLAYPTSGSRKLLGVIAGTLLLTILNLIRIVNLVWIDIHYPDFMEVAHLVIWQGIIVLTAIIYWFLWAERSDFSS